MTLNEMRCIYPSYAEKERLLKEQSKWSERLAKSEKISLDETRQRGITSDERSNGGK